ncbi:hypothetical protein LSA01_12410 [Latilactobacillus sakei]|nr:hypothetical protein LSA01_12410 [Latilactobacillus sakei]
MAINLIIPALFVNSGPNIINDISSATAQIPKVIVIAITIASFIDALRIGLYSDFLLFKTYDIRGSMTVPSAVITEIGILMIFCAFS